MDFVLEHPWELGLFLAAVLALALEAGRRAAISFQMEQIPPGAVVQEAQQISGN